MNKFDKRETTFAALTENKKPDCVTALTYEFDYAVDGLGLTFREAFYYAQAIHFLKDHDGHNHLPELKDGLDTDEAITADLQNDIDSGEYKDQPAYLLRWYNLFRTWDVPISLAFTSAITASMEEWDDHNDLDEAEAIRKINEVPDEATADRLLRKFYTLRNKGNSVRLSLATATDEVEQELQMETFMALFGGGGGLVN